MGKYKDKKKKQEEEKKVVNEEENDVDGDRWWVQGGRVGMYRF